MERPTPRRLLAAAALLVLPGWVAGAGSARFVGKWSLDLAGHLWTAWNAAQGDPTRSTLVAWPHGVDLLPILGGWLDILVAGGLIRAGLPLVLAWNLVLAGILLLAGAGGARLARALGAGTGGALVAGLLLQLDGWTIVHLVGGRTEQAALGAVALALAGALRCWRAPGWGTAVWTGFWGAATVWLSWEHGVWLAIAMVLLLPFLASDGVPAGAPRRWGLAAGVTALLAGPWSALFLVRALDVRPAGEGLDTLDLARENSIGALGWLLGGLDRPAPALGLLLLALPWAARPRDRRIWAGVALLLGLSLVLATGPAPGLWDVGDLAAGGGPYTWLQELPVLGWFHTPKRLLATWSLALPVLGGLAVSAVGRRAGRGPALLLGALLLGVAGDHLNRAGLLPLPVRALESDAVVEGMAATPGPGAVLDLPAVEPGEPAVHYQTSQVIHGRPIPYQATLAFLTPARRHEVLGWSSLARAVSEAGVVPEGAALRADVAGLRARGVRFVVLHPRMLAPETVQAATRALEAVVGRPAFRSAQRVAWDLGPVD